MKDFDSSTMISAREAKAYAMSRRFEVEPGLRVRVDLYSCDSENRFPFAVGPGCVLDSFYAWDRNRINLMGDRGAYFSVFDRAKFFAMFQHYNKP